MLRVLTYHRVANLHDTPALNPHIISATPAIFAKQMRFVARNYQVVSMAQVLETMSQKARLPQRAVLITFDDAYYDFGEVAWPILKSLDLPATLFVPTAYPDHPERSFWWDRLYRAFHSTKQTELSSTPLGALSLKTSQERRQSLGRLQKHIKTIPHAEAMRLVGAICSALDSSEMAQKSVLSWDDLRRLANEGVTICAHTQTHPIMTQLLPEQVRQEITGSHCDLQREIGEVLPIFCYPSGSHDDMVVNILREEGFMLAFTTLKGQNDLYTADPLRLRRTNITRRTSVPILRLRLLRVGAYLDRWRQKRKQKKT
ncbi:MAG: polysaccharide deacetylase family protein [bacterium]